MHRAENERNSPYGYSLDAASLLGGQRADDEGYEVAIYHSHPRSAAEPSQTDINLAQYPTGCRLIVSLAQASRERAGVADRRRQGRRGADRGRMSGDAPLACPIVRAALSGLDERFCANCGMPLVYMGARRRSRAPVSDAHERARKIDPRFTEGELVRVAGGRNQAEAEMIQGMLLEEGVPSILRRSAGLRRARLPGRGAARRDGARGRCTRPRARCCSRPTWRRARARRRSGATGRQALRLTAAIVLGGGVATRWSPGR